jgi:hypothetical protein
MSDTPVLSFASFQLPPTVVSKLDLARLVAEIEKIDNEMTSLAVRSKTGIAEEYKPIVSDQLRDFLVLNAMKIEYNSQSRMQLIGQMRLLKDKAPVVHMTFAVEADRESLVYLSKWMRESVHPQTVLSIGLQPGLVAGVYLRTPNRVHDLSLRSALTNGRDVLVKELGALRGAR